jgi:hypothetical protein
MPHSDIEPIPPPASTGNIEEETSGSQEAEPEHFIQKTNLARISEIDTDLKFTECDQDIEDELLEASLEEYQ